MRIACALPMVAVRKLLVASRTGYDFIVPEDDVVARRRYGKQAINVSGDNEACACGVVDGDHEAMIGANRKFLLF